MEESQREYFLRQQLKAIQEELGEADEQQAELTELRAKLEEAKLPEEADNRRGASSTGFRGSLRGRRVRRHPHVPRVDPLVPLERDHEDDLDLKRQANPRRGSLRPGEGQGAHRRYLAV